MSNRLIALYWWHWEVNFGDYASPYIIQKLTPQKIHTQGQPLKSSLLQFVYLLLKKKTFTWKYLWESCFNKREYIVGLGSIITASAPGAYIWGSGFQNPDWKFRGGILCAVRGVYTANRLVELGFSKCNVYGDPGLLLPLLYQPLVKKKYKVGFIPHLKEFDSVSKFVENFRCGHCINLCTDKIEETIDEILSCEYIFSSSLHGLIVAHAYGIPALFFQYTHKGEGLFKYNDYFSSVGIPVYEPIQLLESTILTESFFWKHFEKNKGKTSINTDLYQMQEGLLKVAPFVLYEKYRGNLLKAEIGREKEYLNNLKKLGKQFICK